MDTLQEQFRLKLGELESGFREQLDRYESELLDSREHASSCQRELDRASGEQHEWQDRLSQSDQVL
jgi:hypothetical protein